MTRSDLKNRLFEEDSYRSLVSKAMAEKVVGRSKREKREAEIISVERANAAAREAEIVASAAAREAELVASAAAREAELVASAAAREAELREMIEKLKRGGG